MPLECGDLSPLFSRDAGFVQRRVGWDKVAEATAGPQIPHGGPAAARRPCPTLLCLLAGTQGLCKGKVATSRRTPKGGPD